MVEHRPGLTLFSHVVLLLGIAVVAFPIYLAFVASTHTRDAILQVPMPLLPGGHLIDNYGAALLGADTQGARVVVGRMMWISFVTAMVIAVGKIAISLLSAFAVVYFRFRFRGLVFWMIFITLMLPVEVRILPTYKVVADLNLLNTYTGLTLPLIASATATFLFRQFFLTVPDELAEAARIDGASEFRIFWSVYLPLITPAAVTLGLLTFQSGWNNFMWPLIVLNDSAKYTVQIGLSLFKNNYSTNYGAMMAGTIIATLPVLLLFIFAQRYFIEGIAFSGSKS